MPDAQVMRDGVLRYLERFNAGDRDGWLELFADGATLEDPVGSEVRVGRDAIGAFWDFAHSLADGVELVLGETVKPAGAEIAFTARIISTLGELRMFVDVVEVQAYDEDGRITSMRAFWAMEDMAPLEG
ncbi:MAG: nuclear transport factor 2 family protein [Acidimicrobiales bacterium]|nr:nuclear transport factor 2 family protein [Acidimicrobiales bacterium]MCB1259830.1 nuclear transport factor 2 family protein [Acidimicrobiales bacterium]